MQPNFSRIAIIMSLLVCGAAIPIQLLTVSFGYAQYRGGEHLVPDALPLAHSFAAQIYIPWILLPGLLVLIVLSAYCRQRYPDIYRRVIVGAATGAVATVVLDTVRLTGVVHGWLPADSPMVFGKLITGSEVFEVYYPVGVLAHYVFGADFGIFYTFVWGKQKNYWWAVQWATVWALLIEFGMMTLPPMAPAVGMFGVRFAWPQLFLLTLTAHVLYGVVLGLLAQHFLTDCDKGGFLSFLRGKLLSHKAGK